MAENGDETEVLIAIVLGGNILLVVISLLGNSVSEVLLEW